MRFAIMLWVVALVSTSGGAVVRADEGEWPGLAKEKLGSVGIGSTSDAAIKQLGEPTQRAKVIEEGATGDFVSDWTFPHGVVVMMVGAKEKGPFTVRTITVKTPSKLKTVEGVGIGSSLASVKKAYGKYLVKPEAGQNDWSVGGGLMFTVEKDKVSTIYLGPLGGE